MAFEPSDNSKLLKAIGRRIGPDAYAQILIYSCPTGEEDAAIEALWGHTPAAPQTPGYLRKLKPVEVSGDRNALARGRSKVVAKYRTWTTDEYMYDIALTYSKGGSGLYPQGMLYASNSARAYRARGSIHHPGIKEIVQGQDPDDALIEWVLESGSATVYRPAPVWRVHGIVPVWPREQYQRWIDGINSEVGTINPRSMDNLGIGTGGMLLIGLNSRPLAHDMRFTYVSYDMAGTGDSDHANWNSLVRSRPYKKTAIPAEDINGEVIENKHVIRMVPFADSGPRDMYKEGNSLSWSLIDNMLNWIT